MNVELTQDQQKLVSEIMLLLTKRTGTASPLAQITSTYEVLIHSAAQAMAAISIRDKALNRKITSKAAAVNFAALVHYYELQYEKELNREKPVR